TLTYPVLDRAEAIVWLVSGRTKQAALAQLLTGDRSVPAGRVRSDRAVILADQAAISP
ncbi:MAG: 6-phosphogluconolactonase, partial [Acidimicrobiales bacterium]